MGEKNKHNLSYIIDIIIRLTGIYALMQVIAYKLSESEKIDRENLYLQINSKNKDYKLSLYEKSVKSVIDKVFSFIGLIVLSPVFAAISAAIYIDDPGPVFFTQKRVGKDKHLFILHKFRSMKMSTPHDVPTHQLEDPEKYITRVGAVLRKTSLDELPQIWDIFRGKMSIIGPRPALWNQEDLIEQREAYGANGILPGLTGLAQIKGRDELQIADKAKFDGEYTAVLHSGGVRACILDIKCFIKTIGSVLKQDGVIEGGTGNLCPVSDDLSDVVFMEYGYKKTFNVDKTLKKRVLVTGAGSYIGEAFKAYALKHYKNLTVDTVDMFDDIWKEYDFSGYDTVFHVAGIAHSDVGKASEKEKEKYYDINTRLAVETCQKSKSDGVKQFIYMSSLIIYGNSASYGRRKVIDKDTVPSPSNFYGDSKLKGDLEVQKLKDDGFHVAVLRCPMIYGKGSKGNYLKLSKIAKKVFIFPEIVNERSMLYIDNLCEFLCSLILTGEGGIYFPQNAEYTSTSSMVKEIRAVSKHSLFLIKQLNPVAIVLSHIPGKIGRLSNKVFGSFTCDQELSKYKGIEYQIVDFGKSIIATEGDDR